MNFSEALNLLKGNKKVYRSGWNGKGMWLQIEYPSVYGKVTLPFIMMKTADNNFVPWLASQTDILADDWMEA